MRELWGKHTLHIGASQKWIRESLFKLEEHISFLWSQTSLSYEVDYKLFQMGLHLQDLFKNLIYIFSQYRGVFIIQILNAILSYKAFFAICLYDICQQRVISLLDGELLT